MTQRQKLLAFIKDEAAAGRWPTRKQMSEHMGWKNASSADDAVWALVKDGHLKATLCGRTHTFEVVG